MPTQITIEDEKYLVVLTEYLSDDTNGAVVSILAMDSINSLTITNIISFGVVFLILVILSFFIIYSQAMKITAPLKKLTNRAVKYANHDYSESLQINTGDEIESLSLSIQSMVESITSHEKSKVALFRNLSHELKTPLTAISGYAENIQSGYYVDNDAPLSIIREECARIKDILENLIFLSKIDSNVESFTFAMCDVVNLVTISVEKLESIAILNDIDIVYNPPKEIFISCDNAKLLRAFINVISNALKYTKDLIEIEIQEEREYVIITVSDNGTGFGDDKIDKLFLTTTGETVDGNGIGLLIVNEVMKNHNGEIFIQNNALGGAEVILKLPNN